MRRRLWVLSALTFLVGGLCLSASAQSIVSARSGAVHYIEGQVLVDNDAVRLESSRFPTVAVGSVLATERGRAEVLLTPGVFLRLPESSSVRMVENDLADTRIELVSGTVLIEAVDGLKDNAVSVSVQNSTVKLLKSGLYYFQTNPARLRVYKGKASVEHNGETLTVKGGKQAELEGSLVASKFNKKDTDALYRWSSRRSSYIASANYPTARSIYQQGYTWSAGGWMWNPYFGMFTYLPASGLYASPFGFFYYSPALIYTVYSPRPSIGIGSGGSAGPQWSERRSYSVTTTRSAPVSSSSSISSGATAASASASNNTRSAGTPSPGRSAGGRGR